MSSKQDTMQSGCTLHSNESRVAINLHLPPPNKNNNLQGWTTLSSATYNGGLQSFTSSRCGVINIKVPPTYDGINPNPAELIGSAIKTDTDVDLDVNATVGMMTAANLNTVRTSSRSSRGVVVDAIVTAGISNARASGADADCFFLKRSDDTNEHCPEPGTINTVVIINTPLTESALIEAYAIAIEAKCAVCAELSVLCSKSGMIAQGTGTDCLVLACPAFKTSHDDNPSSDKSLPKCNSIDYAGKHMLLGEFIGQAVKEATLEAILCNIRELHGSIHRYHLHRCLRWMTNLILCGARPCVPPYPMMTVPSAPMEVLALGVILIIMSYLSGFVLLPRKATVLLGAAAWDRCLPSVPLAIHPVVLAGKWISIVTKQVIPNNVYQSPILGLIAGTAFLVGTLSLFRLGGEIFLRCADQIVRLSLDFICNNAENICSSNSFMVDATAFLLWIVEVALIETTFSLQLLCTIALQMAKFLERYQIDEARCQLSWLCSRDPSDLNREELAGATLESLSENLSDGTIAPWFWYVFLGPSGALGYRIANTLDSRIGYRGGQYEWFGKATARFDDLVNIIPSRMTAILLCMAACITGKDSCSVKNGLATAWRDCTQCSSPNAGWPMAAMSGILGVKLEKRDEYCLGKGHRDPQPYDIQDGQKTAQGAAALALLNSIVAISLITKNIDQ